METRQSLQCPSSHHASESTTQLQLLPALQSRRSRCRVAESSLQGCIELVHLVRSCCRSSKAMRPLCTRLTTEVPVRKISCPAGCMSYRTNWGKDHRSRESIICGSHSPPWSSVVSRRDRLRSSCRAGVGQTNSRRQRLAQKLPDLGNFHAD